MRVGDEFDVRKETTDLVSQALPMREEQGMSDEAVKHYKICLDAWPVTHRCTCETGYRRLRCTGRMPSGNQCGADAEIGKGRCLNLWHSDDAPAGSAGDMPVTLRDAAEALQSYLSSNACMLLFSKLTLYRALGENPEVRVTAKGRALRVSLKRSNGDVEHFNRDGEP